MTGKLRSAGIAAVGVWAACLAGCDKEVEITFVNLTGDSLDVHVTSPKEGREYLGVIAPMGRLEYDLEVEKEHLPARCSWTAGPYGQEFVVDRKTPGKLWIDIRSLEAPRLRAEPMPADQEMKDVTVPPEPIEAPGGMGVP